MNTMINIKTDQKLKREAQKIAQEIGVSLSAIITNYLRRFVAEKQVTFAVPEIPNKKTTALLREARQEKSHPGPFTDADDFMESLLK